MGYFVLVCIVAAMTGCCRDATGKKPDMYVHGESEDLYVGAYQELRIECHANGAKLQFAFPVSTILVTRSEHKITVSENSTYTFVRPQAESSDAGWYACAEEGVEIDDDFRNLNHTDEDVSWIYVYVDDSDGQGPRFVDFDARGFERTLFAVAGSTVVVPCRSTYPTHDVELLHNYKLVDLKENAVRYDPKIGFIMNKVSLVDFGEARTLLQCVLLRDSQTQDYTLRYAGPKPTMISARSEEVTLQEGDELRIECSNETKLSFLFPKLVSNSSVYEIVQNENGTSTFLRRSVISDDTGWYGCAALDIGDEYIPDYSINDTKKEIAWIYVYVNSSVTIVVGLFDWYTVQNYVSRPIIPCKLTSPGLHNIHLYCLEDNSWLESWDGIFYPKVGFMLSSRQGDLCQCTTKEPTQFISANASLYDYYLLASEYSLPVIADIDDPSPTQSVIIKMKGNNLRIRCEGIVGNPKYFQIKWTIPSIITQEKAEYIQTPIYGGVVNGCYVRKKAVTMTILKVTESDSGEYFCASGPRLLNDYGVSRDVEVFDEDGGRYLMFSKKKSAIQVAGLKGETVKWLVDMTKFANAIITWIDSHDDVIKTSGQSDDSTRRIRIARTKSAPQWLFEIRGLTRGDRGVHRLRIDIENTTAVVVNVTVNVEEPPTISLKKLGPELISISRFASKPNLAIGVCEAVGSLELNVTVSFLMYPKFPSPENNSWVNFDDNSTIHHQYKDPTSSGIRIITRFPLNHSGLMICQACNEYGCSEAKAEHLHSVSQQPYFISTNLNDSEVILDPKSFEEKQLILECFVSGTPYPRVTWFKNDVPIEENYRYTLAYDNAELRIRIFYGDEGGKFKCRAKNANGHVEKYIDVKFRGASKSEDVSSSSLIAVIVFLLCIIVIGSVVICRLLIKVYRERKFNSAFRKGAPDRFDPELPIVDQAHLLPYHLKWEFPRELLKLDKILGSGAFGIVKKAEAKSICRGEAVTTVAVKLVRSTASLNFIMALQRELKILAYLGKHPNVVNLLGACTGNVIYGELFVIVEYCRFGNVHDYLLAGRADFVDQLHIASETSGAPSPGPDFVDMDGSGLNFTADGANGIPAATLVGSRSEDDTESDGSSDDCAENENGADAPQWASKYRSDYADLDLEPISTRDLVYWSWQVSRAMDFLGKRKIVHGDLAARNILLSENGIVKVCDFGLAKALIEEVEFRDQGENPLPYRWMAIESIKDRVFSFQSDVWSFGVVMWELFTLAETPYSGIRHRHLLQKLTDGYRLQHPKYAATSMYDMMRQCWEADPIDRPSFADLGHNLGDLLEDGFKAEYLEMHGQYTEVNAEIAEKERQDYLALSLEPPTAPRISEQMEIETVTQDRSGDAVQTENQSKSTLCHCFRV